MQVIRRFAVLLALAASALAGTAAHALGPFNPVLVPVVEFYNVYLDHYFISADEDEIANIANGKAGPGWVRTGYAFYANHANDVCPSDCGSVVSRFYGTPGLGPNSHFFTADAAEAEGLKRPGSGWTYEKGAFRTPVPDAAGQCFNGWTGISRLYNNRFMFNDSNHRYTASDSERARLVARGWIDEGVRFCSLGAVAVPYASYPLDYTTVPKILPDADCRNEAKNRGVCIAIRNLPVPSRAIDTTTCINDASYRQLAEKSGLPTCIGNYVQPDVALPGASDTFVSVVNVVAGYYINTNRKGASPYSNVSPHYQLRSAANADGTEERFFPWNMIFGTGVQLELGFRSELKRLVTAEGNFAYGHPTVEFVDARSGHHFLFNVLAFGNATGSDFVGTDATTGKVIVGTTFRDSNPWIRSLGAPTRFIASPYLLSYTIGDTFTWRMDAVEFKRVIDAARGADPALSADIRDYFVDNFRLTTEVAGNGELGGFLNFASLTLIPR